MPTLWVQALGTKQAVVLGDGNSVKVSMHQDSGLTCLTTHHNSQRSFSLSLGFMTPEKMLKPKLPRLMQPSELHTPMLQSTDPPDVSRPLTQATGAFSTDTTQLLPTSFPNLLLLLGAWVPGQSTQPETWGSPVPSPHVKPFAMIYEFCLLNFSQSLSASISAPVTWRQQYLPNRLR